MNINKFVKKMNLSRGDVLLIKAGSPLATTEALDELGKLFEKHYKDFSIVAIVVDELSDIEQADPATMQKFGWIRLPNVKGKNGEPNSE